MINQMYKTLCIKKTKIPVSLNILLRISELFLSNRFLASSASRLQIRHSKDIFPEYVSLYEVVCF